MWTFLATEILFFGGLFAAYTVYRSAYFAAFVAGSEHIDVTLGTINTVVLIGSSLSAAWSVRCAQLGQRRGLVATLLVTLALASVFMTVKYFEYSHKLHNGVGWGASCRPSGEILATLPAAVRALPVPARLGSFFSVYYLMTGLHGTHVLVGMGLYGWLVARARRGDFGPGYFAPVDVVALYWHLVDVIWIFLFPLFYLI